MDVEKILPFAGMLLTFLGGLFLEKRMRAANVAKAEAEAQRTLAEAEKIFAEADGEEARQMQDIIGAWRALYERTQERMTAIEAARETDRVQLAALQEQVKRLEQRVAYYRRIVDRLIKQITDHGLEPVVRPDEDENGGERWTN